MCFRKIFGGNVPVAPVTGDKVLLSFAINDYVGSNNDLNGCLNDQLNIEKTLKTYWPEFEVKKFKDSEVTGKNFELQVSEALKQCWDTVILVMDCCFSEDNTRGLYGVKNRFVNPGIERVRVKKRLGVIEGMKHIAFSACQDYQTAADAYIGGKYNGAFTYFACKSLKPEMTYKDWYMVTKTLLAESNFEQIPELQGNEDMLNKKVFSDKTLVIHYSGHGTYTNDTSGDEADKQDEAMYLYDGAYLDDRLSKLLSVIISC